MFKIFKGAHCLINLSFRAKVTLKASEKLHFVNSSVLVIVALENNEMRVARVTVTLH